MEKIIALTLIGSLATVPAMVLPNGNEIPALTKQLMSYGETASGAVSDIISEKEFGRENAEWLVKHYNNTAEMTLLCGCAEGWGRFMTVSAALAAAKPAPESNQSFSDKLLPHDKYYKEQVNYIFHDPSFVMGTRVNTDYRVLDGTLPAATACSAIGRSGVRLALEMSFRTDKNGINRLRDACQARGS